MKWLCLERWAMSVGWTCTLQEFVTSELGEAMVRRRVAGFVFPMEKTSEAVEFLMIKSVTPPAMGSYLKKVEEGTHKDLHPPAAQPTHEQIARRILWLKARSPGVKVVLAKKDVAGAFRLLWLRRPNPYKTGGC